MSALDALRRRALANGAELIVDGQSFNAARRVVPAAPVAPPVVAPPPPAPIAAPTLTKAQVQALLDERDAAWKRQFDQLAATMQAAQPKPPCAWRFDATYDSDDRITNLRAVPETTGAIK